MAHAAGMDSVFIGVDVGTSSARAGLFSKDGRLLGCANSPIQIWKEGDFVEQSSADIWNAVCAAVKAACVIANVAGEKVTALGFAATCSLVALDEDGSPVTVSCSGDTRRNIIVWMDHRAVKQAEIINSFNSPVLQYCGGSVSPEMQPPKLLWVKENIPASWSKAFLWMDLSDWLTFRATGDDTRSLCTTVCKWTYLGHKHMDEVRSTRLTSMDACGWDDDFWVEIGLGDLVEAHHAKIGKSVAFPAHPLGSGLTVSSAKELGLREGISVGTSLIDAHAGGVGVMGCSAMSNHSNIGFSASPSMSHAHPNYKLCDTDCEDDIFQRMALVCGTSTCHMAVSPKKLFIPGIWGPYWSAMVPGYWLMEGGQSATGALLDHIIQNQTSFEHLSVRASSQGVSMMDLLNNALEEMMVQSKVSFLGVLSKDIHVLPEFHGNRSPIADPGARGVICGLTLDSSEQQLALVYLATIQAISYRTRHILEHCSSNGLNVNTLLACGGLAKNLLFVQEQADISGRPIVLPRENEGVLLGAAMLGAVATKAYPTLLDAMKAMNAAGQVICPSVDPKVKAYHEAKYKIFLSLYEQQLQRRRIMARVCS